jgi:hypothetical protein
MKKDTKCDKQSSWLHRLVRLCPYLYLVCLGITMLGASGKYSLAAGIVLPWLWLRERNKMRDALEKIAALPTDQLASPEQCSAVVLAMDALSDA